MIQVRQQQDTSILSPASTSCVSWARAATSASALELASANAGVSAAPGIRYLWNLELNRQLISLLGDAETSVAMRAETALAAVSQT